MNTAGVYVASPLQPAETVGQREDWSQLASPGTHAPSDWKPYPMEVFNPPQAWELADMPFHRLISVGRLDLSSEFHQQEYDRFMRDFMGFEEEAKA